MHLPNQLAQCILLVCTTDIYGGAICLFKISVVWTIRLEWFIWLKLPHMMYILVCHCRYSNWPSFRVLCLLERHCDKWHLGTQLHIPNWCQTIQRMLCKFFILLGYALWVFLSFKFVLLCFCCSVSSRQISTKVSLMLCILDLVIQWKLD